MNRPKTILSWLAFSCLGLLTAFAGLRISGNRSPVIHAIRPTAVMGTNCTLLVRAPLSARNRAQGALALAEGLLRLLEGRFSRHLDASEVGRLNASGEGDRHASRGLLDLLEISRNCHLETGGAFDVTCRPLQSLWKRATEKGAVPGDDEILSARERSNWDLLTLSEIAVIKGSASCTIDLGGIAKGNAIDRATDQLKQQDFESGMVEIGGDLRVFGPGPGPDGTWPIAVRHPPPGKPPLFTLHLPPAAVCTSGDYARHVEIGGKRYSHIIDPRTGRPAETACSVTVIAPDALTADVWATALSVLGPNGLSLLENREGLEACIFTGSPEAPDRHSTPGFERYIK